MNNQRLVLGFVLGAALPVVMNAASTGPFWILALVVGAFIAGFAVVFLALPSV